MILEILEINLNEQKSFFEFNNFKILRQIVKKKMHFCLITSILLDFSNFQSITVYI